MSDTAGQAAGAVHFVFKKSSCTYVWRYMLYHFDYSIPRIVKTLCGVDEYTTCMAKHFWDPVTK